MSLPTLTTKTMWWIIGGLAGALLILAFVFRKSIMKKL